MCPLIAAAVTPFPPTPHGAYCETKRTAVLARVLDALEGVQLYFAIARAACQRMDANRPIRRASAFVAIQPSPRRGRAADAILSCKAQNLNESSQLSPWIVTPAIIRLSA